MSDSDFRRLQMAARAYRAAQPTDLEVEQGVRRALTVMRRSSRPRRHPGVGTTLAMGILAFATLSYARPGEMAAWFKSLFSTRSEAAETRVAKRGAGTAEAPQALPSAAATDTTNRLALAAPAGAAAAAASAGELAAGARPTTAEAGSVTSGSAPGAVVERSPQPRGGATAAVGSLATRGTEQVAPAHGSTALASQTPKRHAAQSRRATWAEVSTALAKNDSEGALRALGDLAQHGDSATRAKAELGLAQLYFAHGNRVKACGIARSLVGRSEVSKRIQERAQGLLADCGR